MFEYLFYNGIYYVKILFYNGIYVLCQSSINPTVAINNSADYLLNLLVTDLKEFSLSKSI